MWYVLKRKQLRKVEGELISSKTANDVSLKHYDSSKSEFLGSLRHHRIAPFLTGRFGVNFLIREPLT
jgi:hypothetical protein